MAFVIRVREWQDDILKEHPQKPESAWILGELLSKMAQGWRVRSYTEYLPEWNLDSNPPNRGRASEALGYIWRRCQAEFLPELNYLVVSKRTGLPGKFMRGAWEEKYGSTRGYEFFCKTKAQEAIRMLDQGLVTFNLENVLTRKKTMEILKDEFGEPSSIPDDAFAMYGKPLSQWLWEKPNFSGETLHEADWFSLKYDLAHRAVQSIAEVRGYKNATIENCAQFLRVEPYVIEHYHIEVKEQCGSTCPLTYYFVFKEDNNGSTYVAHETINNPLYEFV